MKATVYKCEWINKDSKLANGEKYIVELNKDPEKRLRQLQKIVGGWIDIYNHQGNDIVLNDEGLINGEPLNWWAKEQGLNLFGTLVKIDGILE